MIKKIVVISLFAASCYACSGPGKKEEKNDTPAAEPVTANTSPDYEKGLALIAKSDCLTCHKVDEKVTGPAYRDIANKYPDNEETINNLAGKIVKGGSGVWGTVPMAAHPALSEADAKQMAKYIMLLKNK